MAIELRGVRWNRVIVPAILLAQTLAVAGLLGCLPGGGCPGDNRQPINEVNTSDDTNNQTDCCDEFEDSNTPTDANEMADEGYDPKFGCDPNGTSKLFADLQIGWGDLHSHTTYSQDANDKNSCMVIPADALTYAHSEAALDFVSITDHAEANAPGYYTQEKWNNYIQQIYDYEHPYDIVVNPILKVSNRGAVVFPGFEYTKCGGGRKLPKGNGHKDIICYDTCTAPWRGLGYDTVKEDVLDDANNVVVAAGTALSLPTDLWAYLEQTPAQGFYISIPHHPAKSEDRDNSVIDVRTDWSRTYMEPNVQTLVEVYSRHGSSEMSGEDDDAEHVNKFDPNCSVETALGMWFSTNPPDPAYKLGFVGGTDTHDGNPGAVDELQTKPANPNDANDPNTIPANVDERLGTTQNGCFTGGLTAVWAGSKSSRDDLWNGLKNRLCYATSGARIRLEFTLKLGDELVAMGSTVTHAQTLSSANPGKVYIHVKATGENGQPITRVQIFKVEQGAKSRYDSNSDPNFVSGTSAHVDYADTLESDYAFYRVKVWMEKASNPLETTYGNIWYERAWSSPIWVEKE